MKPLIGITANLVADGQFGAAAHLCGPNQTLQALPSDYPEAVRLAGGIPVILPILSASEDAASCLERLDGIVFSGGCDISPLCFGADVVGAVGGICPERDRFELALIKTALALPGFPILGICRGCQLLNVALGGSLILDIDTDALGEHCFPEQHMSVPTHSIEAREGALVHRLLGAENRVNSYHHQCVDRPGEGIVITARGLRGSPECIETPARAGFTLGVQWHPESLAGQYDGHLSLFRELVRAADENRSGRK